MSAAKFYRVPVVRPMLVRDSSVKVPVAGYETVADPTRAAQLARAFIGDSAVEQIIAILLNARNRIIAVQVVGTGTVDRSPVFPQEVARAALLSGAKAVVLAHNHPSGDVTPSSDDHALTEKVQQALGTIGTPLLDHLIVGPDPSVRFWSFKENGLLR